MNLSGAIFALVLLPSAIISLSVVIYYVSKPKDPQTPDGVSK